VTRLNFLGATQTVTGSKSLLQIDGSKLLVDCGLFQGGRDLRERNWSRLPIPPATVDAVILTHAHLDHSGYVPRLVRDGFRGPIFCTPATADLCEILLLDSAHLMERDAEFANRHGYSRHKPASPLYTVADAEIALQHLRRVPFDRSFEPFAGARALFRSAGHILGASMVEVAAGRLRVLFSGDLGRPHDPIMLEPSAPPEADVLVVESTYGDRRHPTVDVDEYLARIITKTVGRGGSIVVPAFAVGRAQSILYYLERLKRAGRIPNIPVFLDSPMAVDASDVLCRHLENHKLDEAACRRICSVARYVRSVDESKALDHQTMPRIIVSASGMATGGRVLHHLKALAPDARNTVLLTGFQAAGTRGAELLAGARQLTVHGEVVPVRASVENLEMLSAHADVEEILSWLRRFPRPPRRTFVIHGEAHAAESLAARIDRELHWAVAVPSYGTSVELADSGPPASSELARAYP